MKLFRHIINAALAVGIATENPPEAQNQTSYGTETPHCLKSVLRAGGIIPATWRLELGQVLLIEFDQGYYNILHSRNAPSVAPSQSHFVRQLPLRGSQVVFSPQILALPPGELSADRLTERAPLGDSVLHCLYNS